MYQLILALTCILLISAQYPQAPSYYGVGMNNYYGYNPYGYGNSRMGNSRMYYQQQYAQQQQYYNNYYPYNYGNYYSNSYAQPMQSNWGFNGLHNDGNGNLRIGNDLAALYLTCNGRGCPVRG